MPVQVDPGTKIQISMAILRTLQDAVMANEDHVVVASIEHDEATGYVVLAVERTPNTQPEPER